MQSTKKVSAGRPTRDGVRGTGPCNITLDQRTYDILHKLGKGNISLGVRLSAGLVQTSNAYAALQASLIR